MMGVQSYNGPRALNQRKKSLGSHVQVCLLQVSQVIQSDHYWRSSIGLFRLAIISCCHYRDYEIFSGQTIGLFVGQTSCCHSIDLRNHQPPRSCWLDEHSCGKAPQLVRDVPHNPEVFTPILALLGVPVVVPPPPQHVLHSLVPSKPQGPL